jgi:sec-independent protein translocase protein TatC
MVDPADAIVKARAAVSERAELPGMTLMEHLEELRKRIVHSAIYLAVGFFVCWFFRDRIVDLLQAPLTHIGKSLVFTHPMDALNLDLQVAVPDRRELRLFFCAAGGHQDPGGAVRA